MKRPPLYRPRMPALWFLTRPNYIRYMLRELSCIWIGAYAVTLTVGILRLSQGRAAWEGFWQAFSSPPGIAFQFLALAFTLYHAVSWFALAPSTMPIWRGESRVPPGRIELAHYVVWVIVSVAIIVLLGM